MDDKKKEGIGCAFFIAVGVIISIITTFLTLNKKEIADNGFNVLVIIGLIIAFIVINALFGNKKFESPGCLMTIFILIASLAIIAFIVSIMTSSNDFNYIVGIILIVVFSVGGGIFLYKYMYD